MTESEGPSHDGALKRAQRLIYRVEDWVLATLLGIMIFLATAQIALRNLFDTSFVWGDPLLRVMVLWVGLLGALAASRERKHITVDVLSRVLRGRMRALADVVTNLFATGVTAVIAWHAWRFVQFDREGGTIAIRQVPLLGDIPTWTLELILPYAFALISLRFLLVVAGSLRALLRGPA